MSDTLSSKNAVLAANNVTKQVSSPEGTLTILSDVSFAIDRGDSVAIVGASGAGKSTLLALLAGLDLPTRGEIWSVFRPAQSWRFTLPATILGSFLALMFWIAGMKYTHTGIAAILNQTSTIFILVFASIFLREPFTRRRLIAAAAALAGIIMVTLG